MKKKLQVFISSTYGDMQVERQAAVEAVLRAGHIPAGMELFAAGDESQWETIRRWIDESDVFALIFGGRYGAIEPKSGKSYIELEYDYAIERKKPLFAAVITEQYLDQKVARDGKGVLERDNGQLLKSFREKVTSRICRFYGNINELQLTVYESLSNLEHNEALTGWMRGSDVLDPKTTLQEMARLQTENTELHKHVMRLEVELKTWMAKVEEAGGQVSIANSLSKDAKRLLIAASESDGYILAIRYMGGSAVQAAGKNFLEQNTPRETARWTGALDELVRQEFVESAGAKGETFRVTKRGYEAADEIKQAGGSDESLRPAP
ncbi:MAG: DUF4062 domain-containing protein [Phycisphaerae bacterium]